jgi:hypothetical protein
MHVTVKKVYYLNTTNGRLLMRTVRLAVAKSGKGICPRWRRRPERASLDSPRPGAPGRVWVDQVTPPSRRSGAPSRRRYYRSPGRGAHGRERRPCALRPGKEAVAVRLFRFAAPDRAAGGIQGGSLMG